jgi:hypothetical protein
MDDNITEHTSANWSLVSLKVRRDKMDCFLNFLKDNDILYPEETTEPTTSQMTEQFTAEMEGDVSTEQYLQVGSNIELPMDILTEDSAPPGLQCPDWDLETHLKELLSSL